MHTQMYSRTTTHAHTVARAVSGINSAVSANDASATMEAIKAPQVVIRSITDECTDTYLEKLRTAVQEKIDNGGPYLETPPPVLP